MEENEKAGSCWELNPGHLACEANRVILISLIPMLCSLGMRLDTDKLSQECIRINEWLV